MVILQFSIQQINCVRDKFGNVTEGAADDIQSVYYVWAMEQTARERPLPERPLRPCAYASISQLLGLRAAALCALLEGSIFFEGGFGRRVYVFWRAQVDDKTKMVKWMLREMAVRGMQAIV